LHQWIFIKVFNILRELNRKTKPASKKRKTGRRGATSNKRVKRKPVAFVHASTGRSEASDEEDEEEGGGEEDATFSNMTVNDDGK
jgi:hypothetical protein